MCVSTKFQVSSIALTSFRQGGNFTHPPPPPPPQNEPLKSLPRLGLNKLIEDVSEAYIFRNNYLR